MRRLEVLFVATLLISACGGDSENIDERGGGDARDRIRDGIVCTAHLQAGIILTVLDDATGAPASCGARAVITEGTYSETVQLPPMLPSCNDSLALSGAFERPGIYNVTVSKPGYRDVVLSNLSVTADVCHVIPVERTVRLQP